MARRRKAVEDYREEIRGDEMQEPEMQEPSTPCSAHSLILGLFQELPHVGAVWTVDRRQLWLETAASIFKMIYLESAPPEPVTEPVGTAP